MSKISARVSVCLALFLFLLVPAFAQNQTFFNQGNLVVSVEGCGVYDGTCTGIPNGTGTNGAYGDNQAAPLTLFQFTPNGTSSPATFVNALALPQTSSGANLFVSGEYGSSSEGTVQLAGTDQYLAIMGYGVNANAFNADPTLYGIPGGELGQSGSLTGQSYTPVPRVTSLIDPYGNINSSTAIFNIFNANNPRSTYTADGINIYVSGQGTSGDATGGVFFTTLGASSATTITGEDAGGTASQDTRDVQIYNNTLYISMDSKSGSYNRSYIGTMGTPPATSVFTCTGVGAGCPTGDGTIGPALMPGFGNTGGTGKVTITSGTNSNGNSLNNTGLAINISPENYFFASPSVLYVADSGSPKNTSNADTVCTDDGGTGSVGNGGLQKWVNSQSNGTGTWSLVYTLYKGLTLVLNTACDPSSTDGTTGLIGLTGVVSGSSVNLYATNYTIADLDPTYLYGVTDTLTYTTASQAVNESFTELAAAPSDSNFKGVAFAPTLPAGAATITSSPSGLAFTSTGTGCAPGSYTTPVTLIWTPGVSCQLSVTSPQTASGATYSFAHWQDGTTNTTDTVTAPTASAVYTASFTTTTSIAVSSVSPASEDYGLDTPVTITAVLSWAGNGPAPTAGDVSIGGNGPSGYGTTSCGSPSGDSMTCTATYTPTTADTPGSYTESVSFAGDSNYSASSSSQINNFTINSATSSTSVASSANPSSYGQSVTFTATINGENGNVKGRANRSNGRARSQDITGTATWSSNTGCGTTSVTDGGPGNPGTATCATSILPVGTDTITAAYSGDSNHSGSSGNLSNGQVVDQATTSINVTSVNPSSEAYGQDATVTITAVLSWSGNGSVPTASNITIGGNGPSGYGPTSCDAASSNTITCSAAYTPTSNDASGSYTESATFSGDSTYTNSSSGQTNNFSISAATSITSVTSSLNPSTYGQSVTFTATINGEYGNVQGRVSRNGRVKSQTVGGAVTWSGNTGCGTTSVTAGNPGTATCNTSSLSGGNNIVTATYNGDGGHSGSTGTLSGGQVVNPASQSITVTTPAPSAAVYNSNFTVVANASSNLPITFASSGACTNSGATYTITSGSGSCTVKMSQAGNSNYTAAATIYETTTAQEATQTVIFSGAPPSAAYGTSFTVTATTNAPITPIITTSAQCSASGDTITIKAASGTCTMTATWSGNGNYKLATATQSTTATKATPTVTWNTPAPINYGTALSATQLDATAGIAGTYKYTPASGKFLAAGPQTLLVTFTPTAKTDYNDVTTTVTLQVNQASSTTTATSADDTVKLSKAGSVAVTEDYLVSSYKPTGTVTLTASPTGETCTGNVAAGTGKGSCKLTFTSTGTRTMTASYAGDANHTGSNNSGQNPAVTVTVNPF